MENKRTKIAIVIVAILIILLIVISYFYNKYNKEQVTLLISETNKILDSDITKDNIDLKIKTKKDYAKIEKSVKEYTSKLKNIYTEMEQMVSGINPNIIFSVENVKNKKMDEVNNIIDEYKKKSQNLIEEYEELIKEENILKNLENEKFSIRKKYYTNLYKEIMLGETMKNQYISLEDDIKNEKGNLYDKLNKIEKMKKLLEEHQDSWTIKDDKIQFTSINRMVEYYNLFNQIIDE